MTTNVTDLNAAQMACDSRWSVLHPEFILYIDDTGFDKIVNVRDHAYMFAGNGKLIHLWKEWLASGTRGAAGRPPVKSDGVAIAVCIVNMPSSIVTLDVGQDIKHPDNLAPKAFFAGSGAIHAHTCWNVNGDAMRAVETAKTTDICSGGEVKYLEFSTGANNVTNASSIDDVHNMLVTRGWVMHHNKPGQAVSAPVAAANDAEVKKVLTQIASGTLSASAPCDAMYRDWTPEELEALDRALDKALA